jgi:hypothetical protein
MADAGAHIRCRVKMELYVDSRIRAPAFLCVFNNIKGPIGDYIMHV